MSDNNLRLEIGHVLLSDGLMEQRADRIHPGGAVRDHLRQRYNFAPEGTRAASEFEWRERRFHFS